MRHPIHPMLVHFPVACWTLAVAADFGGLHFGPALWRWSGGLIATGCVMALAAMLAGLAELPHVPDGPASRDAWTHMGVMVVALFLFTISLLVRTHHLLEPGPPGTAALVLDALGFLALVFGGWLGGRMVYGYGVGRD